MTVTGASVKDEVRRIAGRLPDDADWEDVLDETYVRRSIEAGLADARAGRSMSTAEVRRRLCPSEPGP